MARINDSWPAGATYVFQGTVAEDATAGTHVCTLTLTPGVGNEMELLYGSIGVGNTATAQIATVGITDGTNELERLISGSGTTASISYGFPSSIITPGANKFITDAAAGARYIVSGAMQLVLTVTTAAVSVTQTFSVVCRIRGQKPTAVLNDTIGTSTNTVNTDAVF